MPTEPYQPLSVSTGSAQGAIQATPNVTPSLDNLMQGISSGFISVDDLRKRASNGPLEAATRNAELADVQQLRPLQREAAKAQLQNVQAKEQFEAESLPILNDTKREALKQQYDDVIHHGVPSAVISLFNKTVPGFIPYDNAKLFPKEGGLNTAYALEVMQKAFEKAADLKVTTGLKPNVFKKTDASGASQTYEQVVHPYTGQPLGAKVVTEESAAPAGKNLREVKSTRFNKDTNSEEDTVQSFDIVTGQLVGTPTVIASKPVKLTKEQSDAVQFSDRMGFNNQIVDKLSETGFDPTSLKTTAQNFFLPNRLKPEALQSYVAAKDNWITAALRKESGAAIAQSEYKHANAEYFPQDGDSPAVVKQKAALRELAEEDIRLNTPNGGFWKHSLNNPNGTNNAAPAAGPSVPGAAPVAAQTTVITASTPDEAATQGKALPPTVEFFSWNGQTYRNPNFPRR
jgi:hypothetical protein